ncbi:MAG TPA: Na+/H+ antiporter NhaC family protein, partial [Paenibacillus sp.]|nr:Na+/H+ antiporter NhaC family protein [Paenibacillus sp.]
MSTLRIAGIVALTIAGLGAAYAAGLPLAVGFTVGLAALMGSALRTGIVRDGATLWSMMKEGVGHTKEVVWILLMVGLLIPAWSASGVIDFMVGAGLRLLDPAWIVTFGFVFASIAAMTLGTSTGTLSAVGLPLMGIAAHLGVPPSIMAGALVSGAFVGDRTSPFSSAHQLVASSAGVPERSLFRLLQPTTYGAYGIALAFFMAIDRIGAWGANEAGFFFSGGSAAESWLFALPPTLLLLCIAFRLRTRHAFVVGIVAGIAVGAALHGGTASQWLHWLWAGYPPAAEEGASFAAASHGKGLAGMIELVVLIALAGAYNGIMEKAGIIRPIAVRLIGDRSSLVGATARTGLFGLGLGLVSCTQTLPIMMTGRSLASVWSERFSREQLARVTADTSLLLAA